MAEEKSSWDAEYKNAEFKHWEPIYPSPELATLVATGEFGKKSTILDVGCGGGLDTIFLAECGFDLVGVDESSAALGIAQRRARRARVKVDWRLGSVLELPIANESVDFVIDRGLFHVIEDENRPRYAHELYRVLRPVGHVLIRGASEKTSKSRFNPVTEKAIAEYFSSGFDYGPVTPLPLFSSEGALDARIVYLTKKPPKSSH